MIWIGIKIAVCFLIFLGADFMLWRKLREEFSDEEIFGFSLYLVLVCAVGASISSLIETGEIMGQVKAWGIAIALVLGLAKWAKKHKWELWEVGDTLTPIFYWIWFVGGLIAAVNRMWWPIVGAVGGVVIVGLTKRNYRRFRWYKSGKMGLVGLVGIGWVAAYEIAVAFVNPGGIYWGGLKISQFVSAWLLSFVFVAIYIRSGRKFKEELKWPKKT